MTTDQPDPIDIGHSLYRAAEPVNTDAVLSVQITQPGGGVNHRCTAILIAPTWAATAAHCLTAPSAGDPKRLCGASPTPVDLNTAAFIVHGGTTNYASGGETAVVTARHIFTGWEWGENVGEPVGDLALLLLDDPLSITPTSPSTEPPPVGQWLLVHGWGTQADGCGGIWPTIQQHALRTVACPVMARLTDHEFCATTDKAVGPCNGTSGGPAFPLVGGTPRAVAGVFSMSPGDEDYCGRQSAVFTSLAKYQGYIDRTMALHR